MNRFLIFRIFAGVISAIWLGVALGGFLLSNPEKIWCQGFCMGLTSVCILFAVFRWAETKNPK